MVWPTTVARSSRVVRMVFSVMALSFWCGAGERFGGGGGCGRQEAGGQGQTVEMHVAAVFPFRGAARHTVTEDFLILEGAVMAITAGTDLVRGPELVENFT